MAAVGLADEPPAPGGSPSPEASADATEPATADPERREALHDRERHSGGGAVATRPGRPHAIRIPSLGVRARVVPVETTPGRVLLPPSDPSAAGWWRDGALPGADRGSAVVTAHTVSTGGGAFDDLDRLRTGDRVLVQTARGRLRYIVQTTRSYPKRSLPRHAERVFDQSVPGRLVLVTCEDWNGEVYLSNHVVVATPA